MKPLAKHIIDCEAAGIGLKTAVMEHAVMRRGVPYRRLNNHVILVEPPEAAAVVFYDMLGPSVSAAGSYLGDRKPDSRKLLAERGISTPETALFSRKQRNKGWEFAQGLAGAAVVKPTRLARGRGVTTDIRAYEDFRVAWDKAFDAYRSNSRGRQVIVEEFFTGDDFRCFVVGGRFISATQRRRPQVIGDGVSTVKSLIESKNEVRAEHPTLHTYPIPTDIVLLDQLRASGLGLDYVPEAEEVVVLRRTSNLSGGGDSVDMTDVIHPAFRDIAVRAVDAIPGMGYMGVDIIATTITEPPTSANHVVTEVETSPGPMTDFPVVGAPRDMAGSILDYYFPPQKDA